MSEVSAPWFVGRRAELREVSARAAAAASGSRQFVLIEGRAGIGKTSLLHAALDQLSRFAALRADCARGPVVDQLIGEARRLLRGSAGLRAVSDLLSCARAVLRQGSPLVIALDNVQWIDAESAVELRAVLSEVRSEALLVIAAAREPWPAEPRGGSQATRFRQELLTGQDASRLALGELTVAETALLLDRVRGHATEQAAARLHRYTGGHPALISALLDRWPAGAHASPADLLGLFDPPVMGMLRSVAALPAPSQHLLAAMAVADEPWPLAVVGTVARVDDPFAAFEPLLDAGLVQWSPAEIVAPASITYPLYRDVIYRSLAAADREALHARAASFALGLRAWKHRVAASKAASSAAAEPGLALLLEDEAKRYFEAGDIEQAGTLLMWSATVTSDPREHQRQLRLAATWWPTLRALDWGTRLETCLSRWPASAARSLVLALLAESAGRYPQAHGLLLEAGDLAYSEGSAQLLRADLELAMALVQSDLGNYDYEFRLAEGLLAADDLPPVRRAWAEYHALRVLGQLNGPAAALRQQATIDAASHLDADYAEQGDARRTGRSVRLWTRASLRLLSWRLREGSDDLVSMLSSADRADVTSVIPVAHAYLGYAGYLLGNWGSAEQSVAQAIAALSGHAIVRLRVPVYAIAACVEAAAGRAESAARQLLAAQRWQSQAGPPDYQVFPALAAATMAQAGGDYRRMLAELRPLVTEPELGRFFQAWWQPLQVEALIGTGQLVAARHALARLTDLAGRRDGHELITIAWLDAWLAAAARDDPHARERFAEAVARPAAPDDNPLHRARLEHEYGRYLMTGRNRRAAIGRLLHAHELYSALGALPFAERCASDLEACGAQAFAPARGSGAGPIPVMSARERRVAYLAVQGLTNQEIASELFISVKTVEYHLGKVFAKLGISSRRQLAARLSGWEDDLPPSAG